MLRVTGYDVPYPYWTIEDNYMPSVERDRRGRRLAARVIHELPLERRSLHGHFSRDLPPVVTIEPGDSVAFATPNASWMLDRTTEFEPRSSPEDDGHALAGPIEVRGARAGATLVVQIDEVTPGPWGATFTEPPHRIDWELDGVHGRASTGQVVTLRPFLGVHGHAAGRPWRALDDPAAAAGRQHRLQGARRRHDAVPPDPGRRRTVLGRRRARLAGRR